MSLKNITICLTGTQQSSNILKYAANIAESCNAKLNCVYIKPEYENIVNFAFGMGEGSGAVYEEVKNNVEIEHMSRQNVAKNQFEDSVKLKNSSFQVYEADVNEKISYIGKYTDLLILPENIEEIGGDYIGIIQTCLMQTGRPIILFPENYRSNQPKKILISWDGSMRAARSVKASIEVLQKAEEVYIVGINEDEKDIQSANDLSNYLLDHNVESQHLGIKKVQSSIGKTIISEAKNLDVDLVVMGAYTHNKLKQALFGGVTSYIIENTQLPVFMCH